MNATLSVKAILILLELKQEFNMEVTNIKEFNIECPCCGAELSLTSKDMKSSVICSAFGSRGYAICPVCDETIIIDKNFKAEIA